MDEPLRVVRGGREQEQSSAEIARLLAGREQVEIDVGTGDAQYVYGRARKQPETLFVGIDAVADAMFKLSSRIGRKPARGGVDNLLLVVASVENLPAVFRRRASRLTVLFPWGSLLRALVVPVTEHLAGLESLLRQDAELEVLLNMHAFASAEFRDRRALPAVDPAYIERQLRPSWAAAGLEIVFHEPLAPGPLELRTSWGQHLSLNSARQTLRVRARSTQASAAEPPPSA